MKVIALSALATVACAEVLFQETFEATWESRWVPSTFKGEEQGVFKLSAGKFYNDAEKDKGIQTSQDSKFYGISAKFDKFSNKGKDLIIQYQVKHEQMLDCGGGYIKIYPSSLDQASLHGDSPYSIMFGPDICGTSKRVHVIFNYNGKNLLKKVDIPAQADEFTHLYTLHIKPDNTYEVQIDMKTAAEGNLEDDWEFLLSKEIDDPKAVKPTEAEWDERAKIADPTDKKPLDSEDIAEFIEDPEATKPEDWDDEDDGEWEAPQVPNPDFKGAWAPKMIDNPEFKGKWVKPKIANPEYVSADNLYLYNDLAAVGFDLWQVKSGSIFDNVIVATSMEDAKKFAEETFIVTVKGEGQMAAAAMKKIQEEKKAKEELETLKKTEEIPEEEEEIDEEEEVVAEKPLKDEL